MSELWKNEEEGVKEREQIENIHLSDTTDFILEALYCPTIDLFFCKKPLMHIFVYMQTRHIS